MLVDQTEISIISKARQKNVRDPNRSRQHFIRIFEDFLGGVKFDKGTYLDLGAGQFDFCEMVRERGGCCDGVDKDPAVLELGRHKGFGVVDIDMKKMRSNDFDRKYDGIFNKFSLNAFWYWQEHRRHEELVVTITEVMKPGGWAWIAPWNGAPKKPQLSSNDIKRVLSGQKELFEAKGFECIALSKRQSKIYGLNGAVENNVVFTKNLSWLA